MTFIQWMSLNFLKMEPPLSDGEKEKSREAHSSPDGVTHQSYTMTKFMSSVEGSATTLTTFSLSTLKRKQWNLWKLTPRYQRPEEDTALALLEAVWLFSEVSMENISMTCITLTFSKPKRKLKSKTLPHSQRPTTPTFWEIQNSVMEPFYQQAMM